MKNVFFIITFFSYMGMTIDGAWPYEQTLNPIPFGENLLTFIQVIVQKQC